LFIGAEDYVTEYIKDSADSDWKTPISTKIIYYWYEDQKRVKVGEET
jgi:intein-encoded DNA endonuclease-like protein